MRNNKAKRFRNMNYKRIYKGIDDSQLNYLSNLKTESHAVVCLQKFPVVKSTSFEAEAKAFDIYK